jgi:hypothetical protein
MRGATSVAIDPPTRLSIVRRFTGTGDGIAFLHCSMTGLFILFVGWPTART